MSPRSLGLSLSLLLALVALVGPGVAAPALGQAAPSAAASAPNETSRTPYELAHGPNVAFSVALLAVAAVPRLLASEFVRSPCPALDCDPEDVNPFDRGVIGNENPTAVVASDVGFFGLMTLPFGLAALDVLVSDPSDGWSGYATDVVVLSQTLAVALSVNNLFNLATLRPRPTVYDETRSESSRLSPNQYFSFPSGHTLVAFAMATAYSWTYTMRHPDHLETVIPMWIGTYGLAVTAGVGRLLAGEHFPSDVLVGMATGVGVGLIVPWFHLREDADAAGTAMRLAPWVGNGTRGAVFSFDLK